VIYEVLFKKTLYWFKYPGGIEIVVYTAASYLPANHWHLQKGVMQWGYLSNYLCRYWRSIVLYIYIYVCVCVCVCVISGLNFVEGQSNLPFHLV